MRYLFIYSVIQVRTRRCFADGRRWRTGFWTGTVVGAILGSAAQQVVQDVDNGVHVFTRLTARGGRRGGRGRGRGRGGRTALVHGRTQSTCKKRRPYVNGHRLVIVAT